eukprot:scaffold2075_cov444-Prasinococcus_capsulatus_cf.AAC.7
MRRLHVPFKVVENTKSSINTKSTSIKFQNDVHRATAVLSMRRRIMSFSPDTCTRTALGSHAQQLWELLRNPEHGYLNG